MRRLVVVVILVVIGLPLVAALRRYGTLQPCGMLAMETVRLRVASYDKPSTPGLAVLATRAAYAPSHAARVPRCTLAHANRGSVDVMLDCMEHERGSTSLSAQGEI
jgi:hypothetical protein